MKPHFSLRVSLAIAGIAVLAYGTTAVADERPPARPASESVPAESDDSLVRQVEKAIDISSRRYLDSSVHTPWQIIHGILALRHDYLIRHDGEKVNAIEWMSNGATYRDTPWFEVTEHGGRAQPYTRPYQFEGHPNQFLGYLTMADLPPDHEIQAGSETITIADIVKNAQMEVRTGEEITWTLWALSHYLEPDAAWQNTHGESWSIERLVRSQTYEPVENAACGGTHGLVALAYARQRYLETGQPLRGVWLEADQKIKRYIEEARSLQNADGSFSASFFQGRQHSPDLPTRVGASGHTLEFLMVALPEERLGETWVRNGVASVAQDLIESRDASLDCGPLYHAVSGLVIYRDRIAPRPSPQEEAGLAESELILDEDSADDENRSASDPTADDDDEDRTPVPAEDTIEENR